MFSRLLRLGWRLFLATFVFAGAVFFLPRLFTTLSTASLLKTQEEAAQSQVAIVFGAGLRRDGRASAVLRDRIQTAADLFFAGTVDVLLMSGDNRFTDYNEPAAMRDYALSLGVPDEAIVMDFAGRRTYDTCYRARAVFAVENAILVTQAFHQARALYTCNQLGVPATGVPAQQSRYWRGALIVWNLREFFATTAALWDLHVAQPLPVLGEPQPISALEAH